MKDKTTAALLALFLGGLGIHRFYLSQTTNGVLYLVFCWTGIPSVIGFIDGIIFLAGSQANFDSKYNKNYKAPVSHDQIESLKKLRDSGVLTEDEFNAKLKAIVG